jgi:TonB family protein
MRYLVAAVLVLSPLMVTAQTASSAQNSQLAAIQSSTATAKMMMSSASAADRTEPVAAKLRVSTGVIQAKLIHTVAIRQNTIGFDAFGRNLRPAGVSMIVDEEGKPTDLKIIKSSGAGMDANILEAVSQYRFRPATVSGQKIAMPLNLYIDFQVAQ